MSGERRRSGPASGVAGALCFAALWAVVATPVIAEEPRSVVRTDGVAAGRYPAWSPDGARIAFESNRDGNWNLYLLEVATGVVRAVADSPASDRYPAWSPDGERLLFVSDRGGEPDLHLLHLSSGEVERAVELPGEELFPAWSPDGGEIAFTRRRGDVFDLLALRLGEAEPRPLVAASGRDLWPRWSADGRRLAFFSRRDTHRDDDEIYLWRPEVSGVVRLTERPGHDFCPAWNPAGDRLVLVRIEPSGERSLRILDLRGDEHGRLAAGMYRVTEPAWSPDGRFIAYAAIRNEGDEYEIFVAALP